MGARPNRIYALPPWATLAWPRTVIDASVEGLYRERMEPFHILDRPVWAALTGRQAHLAQGDAQALRFAPEYGLFAAAADASPESLAALVQLIPANGGVAIVETQLPPLPPGCHAWMTEICNQMVVDKIDAPDIAFENLTDSDAAEMRALAERTQPGPFFARTHQLGNFIGIKRGGELVAMAGERMKVPGFTEVSAVCTHPDHRGKGHAGALMSIVAARILARGETPFLHVYAHNKSAIALYERLGFKFRRALQMQVLVRAQA
jgi:predicted GNAT family acetyltransferase